MPDPISLNQPPKDALLELINRDNNASFTHDQLVFGVPEVITSGSTRNTRVTVTAAQESGYQGEVDVTYNRLAISDVFADAHPVVVGDEIYDTDVLVLKLNEAYDLHLTEDDYITEAVSGSSHELTISQDSYAWLGSVVVDIVPEEDVIADNALTGFDGAVIAGFDGEVIGTFE